MRIIFVGERPVIIVTVCWSTTCLLTLARKGEVPCTKIMYGNGDRGVFYVFFEKIRWGEKKKERSAQDMDFVIV